VSDLYPREKMEQELTRTMQQKDQSRSGVSNLPKSSVTAAVAEQEQEKEQLAMPTPGPLEGMVRQILSRFGLESNPFVDTVNPDFFYRTEQHERTLFRMQVCAADKRAIGLVTGTSGTGKTLLSQILLKHLDTGRFYPVVVLCSPRMTKSALLREILSELGQEPESHLVHDLLSQLHRVIIEEYDRGRRVVLLVDEAHFLASESLHLIRTLSNLETPREKLITLILFAEEGILRRLNHPTYSSLRGRVALRGELGPMTLVETEQMLKFRMLVAGGRPSLFRRDAFTAIQEKTRGIPREVCKLAYNALLEAYWLNQNEIDANLIRHLEEKGF
jgi:type II secretory pathway predicted ATPase ExeA